MPYFTDEQVQAILKTDGFSNTSLRTLALDLQLARSEMKRYRDALFSVNNIMSDPFQQTDPSEVEHQISSHASTLPIIYRSVAGRVEAAKQVMQPIIFEHFDGSEKNSL